MFVLNKNFKVDNRKRKIYLHLPDLFGFPMIIKKTITIHDMSVSSIIVYSREFAHPLVLQRLFPRYKKLIQFLTEVLLSEEESGDSYREALNQIERFRIILRNRYRVFLEEMEFEQMSKQLLALKKECMKRQMELNDYYMGLENNKRSR